MGPFWTTYKADREIEGDDDSAHQQNIGGRYRLFGGKSGLVRLVEHHLGSGVKKLTNGELGNSLSIDYI